MASIGATCVIRPTTNSAVMRGMPMNATKPRYSKTNAAPPPSAATYENRHILPKPTADPTAARRNPVREPQASRCVGPFAAVIGVILEKNRPYI